MDINEFLSSIPKWLEGKDGIRQAQWSIIDFSDARPNTVKIQVFLSKKVNSLSIAEYTGTITTEDTEDSIRSAVEELNENLLLKLQKD